MTLEPRLDIIGAALADPSRARILCELMDGRAFTNKELASAAGVSPQTAHAHLKKLAMAGLTASLRSGRCTYHRIAGEDVAQVLEGLAGLSSTAHLATKGRIPAQTRLARSCYSHIAGRLGVQMTQRMLALGVLQSRADHMAPGPRFVGFVADLGLEIAPGGARKVLVKSCLDWTERRFHIAGPFATTLMNKALAEGWLSRRVGARSLAISPHGYAMFEAHFGLNGADLLEDASG